MDTRERQNDLGFFVEFPTSKKEAYGLMNRADDGRWELPFRFHT